MRRLTETIEHTKITRILETTGEDPPDTCETCSAPTLWDGECEKRVCCDCGEEYRAIEIKPRLALAAGRR